ncbi:cold shock domain-containing protein [Gemmobacter fulvus]|uniref:Cold shock domain-containing protein n=1 Tax=Gemmobacter fulvus TaxID=2840474 RepID=A0A975P7M5_9RHOB|nr:cold shock domain-containing protein [Gemmobacter fulvus]MBT9244244.1 cold shock domain-containing protein [Gemmobacter fulvus]QWK91139.1 cold shock domain-containing protein [Gemmobacter fulvus]
MTEENVATPRMVHGKVKWFDPAKGFGFILADEGGSDILLHANVLRNYGQSSVADGTNISVMVQNTQRGVQAVEVLKIEPPAGMAFPLGEEHGLATPEEIAARPLEPARVKWFDKSKGFGFANVFGRPEDVFVHVEVLRLSGFADLAAGEAVCLRIIDGKRGRMAVQVVSWEAAARGQDG